MGLLYPENVNVHAFSYLSRNNERTVSTRGMHPMRSRRGARKPSRADGRTYFTSCTN